MNLHLIILAAMPAALLSGDSKAGVLMGFCVAAAVVVMAGIKLSAYGDALGERTGMGSGLVGLLFLAAVTSLPELVVSTTSTMAASIKAAGLDAKSFADLAAYHKQYMEILRGGSDLAVGNMIGSNVMNLMLFVIMDLVQGKGAFLYRLSRNHIMSAASGLGMLGILLFGFAVCSAATGGTSLVIPWLDVGPVTPILLFGYILVMVLQGKLEKREDGIEAGNEEQRQDAEADLVQMPALRFYGTLLFLAGCIVAGGMALSVLGDRMAVLFDLGRSFVGTVFLAVSTSLPELVVCIASVRMGCYNMAVGNVLGSNIFNLVIIFTSDIGLRRASILHCASPTHLVTIAMTLVLTCTVIVGMVYRSEKSFAKLGFDVWLMLIVYALGNVALYMLR